MHITDDLIKSCSTQNRAAQKQLYELLLPYLRAVASRYLRDTSYVKDVLQESFVKIFKHIDSYDSNKAPLNKWAAKIVINHSLNYNKRVIRSSNEALDVEHDIICLPQVVKDLSEEHLLFILKQMPITYFEVFNLFAIEGYKHEEIAEILKVSESLSRKRLSRARTWIKKNFHDDTQFSNDKILFRS